MAIKPRRTDRRTEALSKERIVATAIEILDADGEAALTFRALGARLATGSGAIYWHVADKDELLSASAECVIVQAMTGLDDEVEPRAAIRAIALGVFDAVEAHPWVGAQLNHEPCGRGALQVFEGLGRNLLELGVPEAVQFDAWSALLNYILGIAGQNASNARLLGKMDRTAFMEAVAARWERLDRREHPFLTRLADKLRVHDDREQFLAGLDLILAGIETKL